MRKNVSFYIFSCSWTCSNTSRICLIAVTISLWYQEKSSTHIYTTVHNNLLDYYSFRVCFPNENKPATNRDNQMYEEPLWLWLAVIHESSAEAGVHAFFPPKDSTNLPLKPAPWKAPNFDRKAHEEGKTGTIIIELHTTACWSPSKKTWISSKPQQQNANISPTQKT